MKHAFQKAVWPALLIAGCAAAPVLEPVGESEPVAALTIDQLPDAFPQGGEERSARDIDLIVIHSIGGPQCRDGAVYFTPANGTAVSWRDWFLTQEGKSIHYVVGRDGDIAQQRPELRTAGHVSFHGVVAGVNGRSIGIELVNRGDGTEPFPDAQIEALKALVADIGARYGLPPEAVRTHAELDTRMQDDCGGVPLQRNLDPGPLFPLAEVKAVLSTR